MTEADLRTAILAKAAEIRALCAASAPAEWMVVNLHITNSNTTLNVSPRLDAAVSVNFQGQKGA